jgi:hypothetical protein
MKRYCVLSLRRVELKCDLLNIKHRNLGENLVAYGKRIERKRHLRKLYV